MASLRFPNMRAVPRLLENVLSGVRNIGRQRELLSPIPQNEIISPSSAVNNMITPTPDPTVQGMDAQDSQPASLSAQFFQGGQLPGRSRVPATPEQYQPIIQSAITDNQYAQDPIQYVDPMVLSALLATESSFNPSAVGYMPVGNERAQGMAQFLPSTVSDLVNRGVVTQQFDPLVAEQAIPAAAAYLDYLARRENGSILDALTRYKGSQRRAQEVLDLIGY